MSGWLKNDVRVTFLGQLGHEMLDKFNLSNKNASLFVVEEAMQILVLNVS
jgi:hypothetical protein